MLRVIASLVGIYGLVVVLAWFFQERLLYLPHMGREHVATPADRGLAWQQIELATADGVTLDAWWIPVESARGSLLFLHGNAGNISHRLDSIRQFHRLGLSVLILDYRGYGRSEGRPSEAGTAHDARAGWRWLIEQGVPAGEIVLFGRSLGAAVAAELAAALPPEEQPAAIILESPFRSVPALGQRLYPFLPVRWLATLDYPTERYVRQIESPLLVIHSREDEIIPYAEGEAVFAAANEPKAMLTIRGGHNTGFIESEPEYSASIDDFIARQAGLTR
ncbi:alpha/beta hydrolase [Halomonas sp. MCCC 1A17488]|uniref:alpha/beta hydrolase n=1 Tax=unclassified Halomonas TaxID=2609666 RepID=UPI0018D26EAA|nr:MULTISPECIES: alpha/beta hydrolase [unclassified Halomonas]MCE8016586.1 alpha/beta hydrolase [Halomonas sp. MCCC 1A17488]MCG3239919.1 alpha/beta hydrolase [Halomonas sp. MCCC 1A17488]QPP50188.1 alpha/beta hydrolase [Halomonas sp. SS10-MC5]